MNETFEQCRKNLLRRGFEVRIAATTEEARQILREEIRAAAPETISFGGSMTMEATGIVDELRREGRYRLFDGVDYTLPPEERIEIRRQGLLADLYISGINAITEEGALYWLDGIGNRVAAIAFGPRKVLLVAGRNKIVATRAAAEARIRDIAAPGTSPGWDRKPLVQRQAFAPTATRKGASATRICGWSAAFPASGLP